MSDKELTQYLVSKYPKYFSTTGVKLTLVIFSSGEVCCKNVFIYDSLKTSQNEIDTILTAVLKYPDFKKIKFKSDNPKHLDIFIGRDKNGRLAGSFLPLYDPDGPSAK
jgi:hypothetical protein